MKAKFLVVLGTVVLGMIVPAYADDDTPAEPLPPNKLDLHTTVEGNPIDLNTSLPTGRNTPGVKAFLATGRDPYIDDPSCLKLGQSLFLTSCSGCHGHVGEGKIGPGLNDDYWTYPKNQSDQGIFETMFGGARAMMGPHSQELTLDQFLQVIAWVRHLYKDKVDDAQWLDDEQKKHYKPYTEEEGKRIAALPADTPGQCKAQLQQKISDDKKKAEEDKNAN